MGIKVLHREVPQCFSATDTQCSKGNDVWGLLIGHSKQPRGLIAEDHNPSDSRRYHHTQPVRNEIAGHRRDFKLLHTWFKPTNYLESLHLAWKRVGNSSRPSLLHFKWSFSLKKKKKANTLFLSLTGSWKLRPTAWRWLCTQSHQ